MDTSLACSNRNGLSYFKFLEVIIMQLQHKVLTTVFAFAILNACSSSNDDNAKNTQSLKQTGITAESKKVGGVWMQ